MKTARDLYHEQNPNHCMFSEENGAWSHRYQCDEWQARDREVRAAGWDAAILRILDMTLRPCVQRFAELMEQALRDNDHKGGWSNCDTDYLRRRLYQEAEELDHVVDTSGASTVSPAWTGVSEEDRGRIGREAADVANFAMMIADNCGALKP